MAALQAADHLTTIYFTLTHQQPTRLQKYPISADDVY